jgi:uncharacterized protein (DUF1501 family)
MLTLQTGRGARECDGVTRRDFLRVGTLGLGALSLPQLLAVKAHASAAGDDYVRDKAVVLLYLSGGASHIETFSPNMEAPAPYYSLTGEVKTTLPGVSFGGTFPMLAGLAHKMAVVRSFHHPIGGHSQAHLHVLSGGTDPKGDGKVGYSMGSLYARLRGASNAKTGLPTYMLLTHDEVDSQYSKELSRIIAGSWPGTLGAAYAPFRLHDDTGAKTKGSKRSKAKPRGRGKGTSDGEGSISQDMKLTLPEDRIDDRRALLRALDTLKRDADESGRLDAAGRFQQQAFDLLMGSAAEAFDVSHEPKALVQRYDTSHTKIGKKTFRPSNLGKQMLMARRLVEAGAGFVTVHSAGWDMHADGNNPGMVDGMNMLGSTLDKAVSAFIEDLDARGLSDKVLLVITGDFGRTPKVNNRGGRDHWANLGTLAFIGGGLDMGQVIGQSDRTNSHPATEPVSPQMMLSTIFHTLFDVGQLRVARGVPRDLAKVIEEHPPIKELL